MSSQPVDHLHPVVDFAHRLRARLDSVAETPLLVDDARASSARRWSPSPRPGAAGRAASCGCSPRPTGPRPPSSPVPAPPRTGSRSRPGRYAATPAPTCGWPRALERARRAVGGDGRGRVNVAQARAIVAALDRLPSTGEFAVTAEQRAAAETHLVELAAAPRREGAADPGSADLRGDRPRPGREVRGQGARGRGGPGAAAYDVDDVGGRRGHLPRPLPHPRPARADADQDDPRDLLTRRSASDTRIDRASTPTCPPRSATASRSPS